MQQQPPAPQKYSVLYYKRTNKVHKNKGVTREDGILTISPPPSCICKLVSAATEDDDDDDDADNTNNSTNNNKKSALDSDSEEDDGPSNNTYTKKKKYQQMRKKTQNGSSHKSKSKSGVIFSGVNRDISRRAYDTEREGVNVDDTLVLSGQWECEIVSVLSSGTNASNAGGGGLMNNRMKSGRLGGGNLTMKKQPSIGLGAKAGGLGVGSKMLAPPRAPLKTSLLKNSTMKQKQPLVSKKKVGLGGASVGAKRTLGSTITAKLVASKAPPPTSSSAASGGAGKMKKNKNGEWYLDKPQADSDDEDDEAPAVASYKSKIPTSLMRSSSSLNANKRPRTLSGLASSSLSTATATANNRPSLKSGGITQSNNNLDFPGAKGQPINVPASIRNVLRPHQREGISFIWNCVTGVNEGLKNAYMKSNSSCSDSLDDESDEEEDDLGCASSNNMKVGELKGEIPRGCVLADEMGLGKVSLFVNLT